MKKTKIVLTLSLLWIIAVGYLVWINGLKAPGIYKVFYGDLQPLYVSKDGKLFIYGDMFQISENEILIVGIE